MHLFAILSSLPILVAAHGYLSDPPPRGIQKAAYQIDDLKSPYTGSQLCRGEPVGQITHVTPGQSLTLTMTITAPHVGPCSVTLLDANLANERPIADKYDCAAPGKVEPWTVKLPSDVSGHMVLRWHWQGRHISTPGEQYEQCIDLDFGGGRVYAKSIQSSNGNAPYVPSLDKGDSDASPSTDDHSTATYDAASPNYLEESASYNDNSSYNGDETPAPSDTLDSSNHTYQPDDSNSSNSGNNDSNGSTYGNSDSNSGTYGGNDSSSGGCAAGAYKCSSSDGGFFQCANNVWVHQSCAQGTVCKQTGTTIVCDWP